MGFVYDTPDWPYDLTPEQQMHEEEAIRAAINATCARINVAVQERLRALLAKAMTDAH